MTTLVMPLMMLRACDHLQHLVSLLPLPLVRSGAALDDGQAHISRSPPATLSGPELQKPVAGSALFIEQLLIAMYQPDGFHPFMAMLYDGHPFLHM